MGESHAYQNAPVRVWTDMHNDFRKENKTSTSKVLVEYPKPPEWAVFRLLKKPPIIVSLRTSPQAGVAIP